MTVMLRPKAVRDSFEVGRKEGLGKVKIKSIRYCENNQIANDSKSFVVGYSA